jgi:hypothetical protein
MKAFNCLKETYDLACDPAHNTALQEWIVTESPLMEGRISRFLHVIQPRENLPARWFRPKRKRKGWRALSIFQRTQIKNHERREQHEE